MKKNRILFVHSSLTRGGAEHALVRISAYLAKHGFEVSIFLTAPSNSSVSYPVPEDVTVSTISDKCKLKRGVRRYCSTVYELKSAVGERKPDAIVAMNSSAAVDLTLATIFMRVKKIACERANPYLSMKNTAWYHMKKIFSIFMDGYVFQTERASKFYPACVQKKMAVIPNIIDKIDENRYNPDSKLILAVGNLRKVKGHEVLIKAFSQIKDSSYSLVICGEGDERIKLETQINELNLADRVFLPGKVDNVSEYYQKAALFVLSSYHEGMPNALMEAMSYGLPCVSTDCPMGPAELIRDGENGMLVDVGDASAITRAIDELIAAPQWREKLSKNAFAINRTHSPEAIGAMWADYLKRI